MPAWLAPALSAGGGVLSSLLGSKRKSPQLDLGALVAEAQEHGFNPSTVLKATGGQGFSSSPSVGAGDLLGSVIGAGIQGYGDYLQGEQNRRLADAQIALAEAQTANVTRQTQASQLSGAPVRNVQDYTSATPEIDDIYTSAYWDDFQGPMPVEKRNFPVKSADNTTAYITPSEAKRLDMQPMDALMVEDYEALVGEIGGELEGMSRMGGGFVGQMHPEFNTNFFGLDLSPTTNEGSRSLPQNWDGMNRKQRRDWLRSRQERLYKN